MSDTPSPQQSAASPDYPSGARSEITRLRLKVLALAAENQRLQETVSYQLGSAITRAKTVRGLFGLPGEIIRVLALSHERRGMTANAAQERQRLETRLRTLLDEIYGQPAEAIVASVCADTPAPAKRALLLTELATIIRAENPEKAADVLRGALVQQPSLYRRRLLATMLADIGAIEEPDRMFKALRRTPEDLTTSELSKAKIVEGMARISRNGLAIPQKSPAPAWLASAPPRSIL